MWLVAAKVIKDISLINKLFIISCLFLCALSGCGTHAPSPPKEKPADKGMIIGLSPEQNVFRQMERYQPLAEYLSKQKAIPVSLKVFPSYGNIIDNFVSSGVDGAFFGSFTYVLAHEKLGIEVLVRPEYLDGTSTYHGLIFVRKDSGIKSVKDMRGKRFAFVDKATTAGYLLPVWYFHKAGIKNYQTYLKEVYFTGTHEDAIYDVLSGKADIGAAKNTVFERLAATDSRIKSELVILEKSPDVPENGLAVRKDLDGILKEKLKQGLLNMDRDPDGQKVLIQLGARKFIETKNEDYAPVYEYAKESNLDLHSFSYTEK